MLWPTLHSGVSRTVAGGGHSHRQTGVEGNLSRRGTWAAAHGVCKARMQREVPEGVSGAVGEQGDVRVSPAGKETREAGEGAEDACRDLPYALLCCSVLWLLPEPHAVGGVLLSPRATHIWRRADQNRLAAHYHPVTAYLPCKFQKPNKSCIRWPPESNFIYCL